MARERLDGVRLAWELTMPQMIPGQIAPMPFFIDWGATPHPTTSLPPALELLQLRVGHPDPEWLSTTLADLGELDAVEVVEAAHVSLSAVIRTPDGSLVLS